MNTLRLLVCFLPRYWLHLSLCFCWLYGANHSAFAQPNNPAQVVVSYSYNFAKNIRWPNEQALNQFTIALFELDDTTLSNEFMKLDGRVQLKQVPVSVFKTRNPQALLNANMVFVGNNQKLASLQNLIGNRPILLVTSEAQNKRLVMLNLFKDNTQATKFEVNKANLINNNLQALPELILLGGSEIDVAKLYREGQNSLVKLQNQLGSQEENLRELQEQNRSQRRNNERLIGQMQSLNQDISQLKKLNVSLQDELAGLNQTIEKSKALIQEQQIEIERKEEQRQRLIREVEKSQLELAKKSQEVTQKQTELDTISLNIASREARLNSLNLTIDQQQLALESQQATLKKQQLSIEELDALVDTQQRSIYFMASLFVCGIAFCCLIVAGYRMKQRDNRRLEQRGRELQMARDKLEIAKRKAEAANRAKSAFLSLMSHELRTPLQSIIGYTDLVIEDLKAEGDSFYSDQLIRVNSNGERLLQLINNTLDLAKIEAGKMSVQLTPIHVNTLIEEASSNVKPLLAKNHNRLAIDVDNTSRMPALDHDKMLHMMVNLLSNATKFTKNGTITISIRNQPDLFTLIISDTGIGLDDKQKTEIFNRFHQVNNGKIKKAHGTGLGLSITQYFCEVMGGRIHAEDRIDFEYDPQSDQAPRKLQGSSFVVEIPLPVVIVDKKFVDLEEDEDELIDSAA